MPQTRNNAAENTAVVIRTGATRLKAVKVEQRTFDAPQLYLQLFNTASITPGTTAPVAVVPIPAGKAERQMMDSKIICTGAEGGIVFPTALGYCVTTTHDGATDPDAGDEPVVIIDWEALG